MPQLATGESDSVSSQMIIRICRKEASKRLNINNTVKKVQWTFDSEAENLAERSAVTDSQHIGCVSERRDLAYVPIADNHYGKIWRNIQWIFQ